MLTLQKSSRSKNKKELERFLVLGGLVNVDSLDDLELIKPVIERNKNKTFKLLIGLTSWGVTNNHHDDGSSHDLIASLST